MPPLQSQIKQVDVPARREALGDEGSSCANNAWDCLNTPAQFGVIFSIIIVVITIVWIYWYTVVRPRQERIKESGEDIELDLGDGRTVIVSSGPHQRTVVFRDHRSPTPPPPAYRPPTPGRGFVVGPSGFTATTESSQPSPRETPTQLWPPQIPPQRPQTPQQVPPQTMNTPSFVRGHPVPGSYSQPVPFAMYPPQVMVPGPPPPPPAMMYPRAQTQAYHVIPPPPPPPPQPHPATGMSAQRLIPPPPIPPPPPPPPMSQPPSGGFYQQPVRTGSQLRTRPPSPGHASTIDDDDSDRGGSRPPANRRGQTPSRGRSPPPGGSQFTRSRTPSPSERRRQQARHRARPNPSRSPPRGRQRGRGRHGNQDDNTLPQQDGQNSDSPKTSDTSYRSSTSLDSELRTDLASLLVEASGRQRAHETERLQALVDRYDKEEKEERAYRKDNEKDRGGDTLRRLPGQPMRPAAHHAEKTGLIAAMSSQHQDPQGSHRRAETHDNDNEEGPSDPPKRRVAFHEPSLEVLESRIGRPSRRSRSPIRIPTREDVYHGQSRVGRRRRTPSPDERVVQRPVAPISSGAESRIGRHRPSSPAQGNSARRRDSHRFATVGESRVGHHQGWKRRGTYPPETLPPAAGTNYYNSHDGNPIGQPMVDEGFLNVAQSEDLPSSAGATCASRSQASSDSNDPRRRMGLTPSIFNRDRYQRDHEVESPHLRPPSMAESKGDGQRKHGLKSSWGSKLASFLPTIARLTTNNPVVQEVADDIADEVRARDRREEAAAVDVRRHSVGHESHESQQAHSRPRPTQRFSDPRQRRSARRPHSRGPRQGASRQSRSSNDRHRGHGRRPSTIPEEPRESLQLALEHAAERLAEGAVESALDRARRRGAGLGDCADVMPGQDDRRRRRPRRNRGTEP